MIYEVKMCVQANRNVVFLMIGNDAKKCIKASRVVVRVFVIGSAGGGRTGTGGAEQGHAIGRGRRRAQTTNYADNDPPDCLAEAELPDSRTDVRTRTGLTET